MNDPQDLLYTNKFISDDVINSNELEESIKFYDRYENYSDKKLK